MQTHLVGGLHHLLTEQIIGAAIEVHRRVGPGLLESTYEECLDLELRECGLVAARQRIVPLTYRGKPLASTYRIDLIVDNRVIVEVKAVDKLARVHLAQMLSYLHHTGLRVGLVLNFNEVILRDGVKRVSL